MQFTVAKQMTGKSRYLSSTVSNSSYAVRVTKTVNASVVHIFTRSVAHVLYETHLYAVVVHSPTHFKIQTMDFIYKFYGKMGKMTTLPILICFLDHIMAEYLI